MQIQESLKTARDKYGELADKYKDLDPTPNFKYIEWICKQIQKRLAGGLGWDERNVKDLNQYLIEWDKYLEGGRIPQDKRDINKNTLMDVVTIVNKLRATPSKTQVKRKRRDPALEIQWKTERDDTETVYENKDWIVVIPYSQKAAMELGELSTWCIAYDDSNNTNRNKFWEYVKPGTSENQFYFILSKYADIITRKPTMFAVRMGFEEIMDAYDINDQPHNVLEAEGGFINFVNKDNNKADPIVIPLPYSILKPLTNEQLSKYLEFYDENNFEHNFWCEDCRGEGSIECSLCDGSGTVICDKCRGDGKMDCDVCGGTGTRPCWACEDESGTMKCDDCDGLGKVPCECDGEEECDVCDANGMVSCEECEGVGTVDCSVCNGDGTIECEDCDGDGKIECDECDGSGEVLCPDCDDDGVQICDTCGGEGCRITNFQFCSRCDDTGVDYNQQPCLSCAPYRKHNQPETPAQTEAKEIERLHALIQKNWGNYITHPLKETTQKHHYVSTLKTPTGELLSLHAGYKHNVNQSYLQLRNMNKTIVAEGEVRVRDYLKRVYNM